MSRLTRAALPVFILHSSQMPARPISQFQKTHSPLLYASQDEDLPTSVSFGVLREYRHLLSKHIVVSLAKAPLRKYPQFYEEFLLAPAANTTTIKRGSCISQFHNDSIPLLCHASSQSEDDSFRRFLGNTRSERHINSAAPAKI